jgi:hypothetical protein
LIGNIFRNDLQHSTLAEIANRLACSEMEAARALKYLREGRSAASLDQPVMSPKDGAEESSLHDFVGQDSDLTVAHVGEFMSGLGPNERQFVQMRTAGARPEMPLVQQAVQLKLMAYMGLNESEVEQMSVELTKEKYLDLKAQGRSDETIAIDYKMGKSKIYRLKAGWGLTGESSGKSVVKKSNPKSTPATTTASAQPVGGEWKSKHDALAEYANLKISKLEQEIALLKGMLKFYL